MNVQAKAYELARAFEGLRLVPYRDPAGYWTVGYGHLVTRDRSDLQYPAITQEEAEALLTADLTRAARSVDRLCQVPLSEGQRAALIDFAFNLGAGNLQVSTLRKMVNRGDMESAAREFPKWVYAGGMKLPGLVRRRAAEAAIFGGSHV
jgi:lysozyme